MVNETYTFKFKGDPFENLYRIQGILKTLSPLHIGTGEVYKQKPDSGEADKEKDNPDISEIERDVTGLPYIPGSALRGVVRHYLLNIFRSFGKRIAYDPNEDEVIDLRNMKQNDAKQYMKTASLLEQLMGTSFCESKIEFWDGPLLKKADTDEFKNKGWESERQSYIVRSVCIDPETGAAEPNKLYSFDVAPKGLEFEINIVGRNISDEELGFLVTGLEGFNSPIYPLTIGAMSGRGFGRVEFKTTGVYKLDNNNFEDWLKLAGGSDDAGYRLLPGLALTEDAINKTIEKFKTEFLSWLNKEKDGAKK